MSDRQFIELNGDAGGCCRGWDWERTRGGVGIVRVQGQFGFKWDKTAMLLSEELWDNCGTPPVLFGLCELVA